MTIKSIYKSEEGRKEIMDFYEAHIAGFPEIYETINVDTCCGNTFMIAAGEKNLPVLILLHGSSTNSLMWMADIADYSKKYRVIAVDIPGEPGKSAGNRPDLKSDEYVIWMEDIFRHLGIKKASFIGISLGGWMSLKIAASKPGLVDKLVLLCPSGIVPENRTIVFKLVFYSLLGRRGMKKLNDLIYGKVPVYEEVAEFGRMIAKHYIPRMDTMPIFSDRELGSLSSIPMLFLFGEKDPLIDSAGSAVRLKKLLSGAEVNVLPDTAHVIINVAGRIMEFLGG